MKRKTIIRCELAGAALILFSAGWELFIERPLTDMQTDAATYSLGRKIDQVWMQVGAIRQKIDPDPDIYGVATIHPYAASRDLVFAGNETEFDSLNRQAEVARWTRAIMFLVGSVLLLLARWYELRPEIATAPPTKDAPTDPPA